MGTIAAKIRLKIRLYGAFSAVWEDGNTLNIRSAKNKAMIAMLATAPEGARTRAWLQDVLWSRSGHELGRASLRRALSDLKQLLGDDFERLIEANPNEVRINLDAITVVGELSDGPFLEGLKIEEYGFQEWVQKSRETTRTATPFARIRLTEPSPLGQDNRLQPRIAILPLTPLRGYDGNESLGDMVSEEVTRALSRSDIFDVISHLSCRNLDPRTVGISEIQQSLATDYVISGGFRTVGDQMVLKAECMDPKSGSIRWTRELRGSQREFLAGGEELVQALAREIGNSVVEEEAHLGRTRPMPDVASHALLISGISLMHRQNQTNFARSKEYIEELISRVPHSSILYAWLAKWYVLSVVQGWSSNLKQDGRTASDFSKRALDLDPECSFSLCIDGFVNNNLLHRLDLAMDRYELAVDFDPNNALAWLLKGTLHAFQDEGDQAVAETTRARTLSPLDPHSYFFDSLSATSQLAAGNYGEALSLAERSLRANWRHVSTQRSRTIALVRLGRMEEARQAAEDLLRTDPKMTVTDYLKHHPAALYRTGRDWADALRQAGVPK